MLEAWEQVLIPDVGDEGIRHILYGGELLVGRGEATTEVVEVKLRATLRLVAHTQGRGEVQRRAGDRRSRDTADDGVAADARRLEVDPSGHIVGLTLLLQCDTCLMREVL